jgi:hypothetical protein
MLRSGVNSVSLLKRTVRDEEVVEDAMNVQLRRDT